MFLDRPCSETGAFDGVVGFAGGLGGSGGRWFGSDGRCLRGALQGFKAVCYTD